MKSQLGKKISIILTGIIFLTGCFFSPVYAASKTVKAEQGIVIVYNGQKLTDTEQPYLINGTTYVPIRMLVNYFNDKSINWDGANKQVIITDKVLVSNQLALKEAEIQRLKLENEALKNQLTTLQQSSDSDKKDLDLDDLEDDLEDIFDDAGYFRDDGIKIEISLDGDEDEIEYEIVFDFDDSDDYDDLTELKQSKLEDFLDDVKAEIEDAIEDTEYEDADIEGKLEDDDDSRKYVKYNGRSYTFSWDDIDTNDIEDDLDDYFADAGDDYFADEDLEIAISVSGDEDDLTFKAIFDFGRADYFDDLTELYEGRLESFLRKIESRIEDIIEDSNFEDADITGKAIDDDEDDYYVEYDGSDFTYSWDD